MNCRADGVTVDNDVGDDVKNVVKMIVSLQCIVSNGMTFTMDNERIETIVNMIKVFLSEFHEFDKEIRRHESKNTGNMKPLSWMSSYNFMCLPNLTKAIQKYGPLRNLWEGILMG